MKKMNNDTLKAFCDFFLESPEGKSPATLAEINGWVDAVVEDLLEQERKAEAYRQQQLHLINTKLTPSQQQALAKAAKFGWQIKSFNSKTNSLILGARGVKKTMEIYPNGSYKR